MIARILRIELRRSFGVLAALLITAAGVFVLFASNPPYGSWMELAIVQRDILQLTWPLALAAGAWQGLRDRRNRVEELFATTARPRRWRIAPVAAAMALTAVVGYLVMLAGAVGHLRHPESLFPAGAGPLIAVGALSMVAAVWLGLAVGALVPSPLVPALLAVVGFVALALLPSILWQGDRPGLSLLFPSIQGPRNGGFNVQMLSARANLSQSLWLAAAAATGVAVFAAARPVTRLAALLPIVVGGALAVPAMPPQLAHAWVEDRSATAVVCTSDAPKVCTARVYAYALDELTGPARQALAVLSAKLPPAPTRVLVRDSEDFSAGDAAEDTLTAYVSLVSDDIDSYTPDALLRYMLDGAGARSCYKPPPPDAAGEPAPEESRAMAARLVVVSWLLDEDLTGWSTRREPFVALADEALTALRAAPGDVQRSRIAAYREAEKACADGDRLDLLTSAGGAR